jgi:hypothetical protein
MGFKEIGYWSLYFIPGGPTGLLIYESLKPKHKRNKIKLATSAFATASFVAKVLIGLGAYHALPEKYKIFNKEKEENKSKLEIKVFEKSNIIDDKTYIYKGAEYNRKVYKE